MTTNAVRPAAPMASQRATTAPPSPGLFWRWVWDSTRPVLGYVLLAVGFLLLLIAYLGVSREVLVARQLPYLVSGGLTGLALVTLGARMMLIEDLRRDAGRLDRIEAAVDELRTVLLARPDAPAVLDREVAAGRLSDDTAQFARQAVDEAPDGRAAATNGSAAKVYVLDGGETFHRGDCTVLDGKTGGTRLTRQSAQRKGLRECPLCRPTMADALA